MELRFLFQLLPTWDINGFLIRFFSEHVWGFEIRLETESVFADNFEASVGMLLDRCD